MSPGAYRSVFRPGLFADQLVWVTGGGSGIGRCVAHELAALGARVLISAARRQARSRGGRDRARRRPLRERSLRHPRRRGGEAGVATVLARHGAIAGLVNNAGGQFPAPLAAISKKGFDAVVANNLAGGFLMMREVFNQSMAERGGAIVNMTADFRNGMPGMGHSGAARAGMSNLTMTRPTNGRAPACASTQSHRVGSLPAA